MERENKDETWYLKMKTYSRHQTRRETYDDSKESPLAALYFGKTHRKVWLKQTNHEELNHNMKA